MFLLKNLVSSISKVTQDLGNIISVNTNVSGGSSVDGHISTSGLLSDTLSTVTNTLTTTTTGLVSNAVGTVTGSIGSTSPVDTVTNIIGGVTGGISGGNPLETVTNIIGGVTGGVIGGTSPISPVIDVVQGGIDILQGVESLKTEIINTGIETVAGTVIGVIPQTEHPVSEIAALGTLTFETSRDTVNGALEVVSDLVGGDISGATASATGIVETLINNGTTATGIVTGVVGSVTDVVGGVTGGVGGNPLEVVTNIIGGVTGGVGGNPLEVVTDIIGGVTGGIGGGTSPISPVIDVVQGGIDILQGVESLKTEIINTGIDTVADTIISILPQTEHPVSEIADLGTLTFETSRDTVNGALEVVSDLVGGDISGATESATGILGTLVTNGSTATGLVTEILGGVTGTIGGVTGGVDGNPLEVITDIIGGVTGGVGGNPLEVVTDIIGGVTGGVSGNPLEVVTDIIGGVTGGIGGGTSPISPVIDVVQGGIDILQGVESLKTEIINTGIDTVADTIIGILPQVEHPVSEIADLGTLTFETSRDTVNGALETVSDLVGGDIQGATESATGILGTLITNGSTATGLITEILGGVTGTIGGATGSDSPLGVVTDLLGGVTGGTDNPIGIVTDIVGSLTGGVTGQGGLDVISNLLGGLIGGVTSTVSSVTHTTHTIVPQSLLTDNFLDNSFHTV